MVLELCGVNLVVKKYLLLVDMSRGLNDCCHNLAFEIFFGNKAFEILSRLLLEIMPGWLMNEVSFYICCREDGKTEWVHIMETSLHNRSCWLSSIFQFMNFWMRSIWKDEDKPVMYVYLKFFWVYWPSFHGY